MRINLKKRTMKQILWGEQNKIKPEERKNQKQEGRKKKKKHTTVCVLNIFSCVFRGATK